MATNPPFGQLYDTSLPLDPADWLNSYDTSVLVEGSYCEIWSGMSPDSSGDFNNELILGNIPLIGGTITVDRNNTIRRTATNLVISPDFNPTLIIDAVGATNQTTGYGPYGQELRIYKGFNAGTAADPDWQYAALGIFFIEEVDYTIDDTGTTMNGTLKDRMQWLSRRAFTIPFGIVGGTYTPQDAIGLILLACCGTLYLPFTYNFFSIWTPFPYINAQTYNIGDDPAQACLDIAAACGFQLYFDYAGNLQLMPIPTQLDDWSSNFAFAASVVAYESGDLLSPLSVKRALSNAGIPNVYCLQVQGSNVATPFEVFAWISDSSDPLYYADPPGSWDDAQLALPPLAAGSTYPTCIVSDSTAIISGDDLGDQQAAAQIAAVTAVLLASASVEQTTITIRDQPAHDVDDTITLLMPNVGLGAVDDEPGSVDYVLDQVVIDLDPSKPTSLTGRIIGATPDG
jgi:hypothetical protein